MDKANEAVIVIAKCGASHKSYGIRAEKTGKDKWLFTWAFPIKDDAAKREAYDRTTVKGSLSQSDEYPGCPYCGSRRLIACSCGHMSCYIVKDGVFTCDWCGSPGTPAAYTGGAVSAGMDS